MGDILIGYELNPTTWVYLSSLMIIGIFFKFSRVWSVRNIDLLGLIASSMGLLLIARDRPHLGFVWLFAVTLFFLVRMLLDTLMVRRPLLEPNLSLGGLTFTVAAMLVFLTANVITGKIDPWLAPDAATEAPGFAPFHQLAQHAVQPIAEDAVAHHAVLEAVGRTAAILGHLFVVLGLVLIGYRHFDNIQTGVAAAALYVLLPYTAQTTNCVDHVVPAALLVWAAQCYRRPLIAGLLVGTAAGLIYYPIFLLPLWGGFYLRRGLLRFLVGVLAALAAMVLVLALVSDGTGAFLAQLRQMVGFGALMPAERHGFWEYYDLAFRYPVMAAFAALSISLALWPAQKNFGMLLSCSAAVMIAAQFWHPLDGGLYQGWYLPLLILTVLRPNLEDRVALATVREVSFRWRRRAKSAAAPA